MGGRRSVAAKQPKYFLKMNCICCHVEEEVEEDPVDKITNAFNVMDINGDGFVTFNEFKKVRKSDRTNDSPDRMQEIIKHFSSLVTLIRQRLGNCL